MVIFISFNHSLLPTFIVAVEVRPTRWPVISRSCAMRFAVVDFPLVPVTPMTISFSDGWRYHAAANRASDQWYQRSIDFGMRVFTRRSMAMVLYHFIKLVDCYRQLDIVRWRHSVVKLAGREEKNKRDKTAFAERRTV